MLAQFTNSKARFWPAKLALHWWRAMRLRILRGRFVTNLVDGGPWFIVGAGDSGLGLLRRF